MAFELVDCWFKLLNALGFIGVFGIDWKGARPLLSVTLRSGFAIFK